jgi:hypothetical protein
MEMDTFSTNSVHQWLNGTDPIDSMIDCDRITVLDVYDEEDCASKRRKISNLVFLIVTAGVFDEPIKQILPKTIKDRSDIWLEIKSWSHSLFRRAFRMTHVMFEDLVAKIINVFPGPEKQGYLNYINSIHYGTIC